MPVAERNFYRTLITVVAIFLALLAFGCAGYMLIEGWTWTDNLHMTVITLSTVGFGEVRQLSQTGRIFTGVMIIMGVSATAFTSSSVAEFIVSGEFRRHIRGRRMQYRIGKLNAHFIICGNGRPGEQVRLAPKLDHKPRDRIERFTQPAEGLFGGRETAAKHGSPRLLSHPW